MIYFTYRVGDAVYELNENEHRQVLEAIEKGRTGLVVLREGELIFNLSFIRSVQVDEESVRLQAQNDILKLGEGKDDPTERQKKIDEKIRQIKKDLTDKLNW